MQSAAQQTAPCAKLAGPLSHAALRQQPASKPETHHDRQRSRVSKHTTSDRIDDLFDKQEVPAKGDAYGGAKYADSVAE